MMQIRNSPIIVGERYELAETLSHVGDNDTGLLAKSEYQAALLSMSEYDRHVASQMDDYGSRKSSQVYASIGDYSTGRTVTDGTYSNYTSNDLVESQAQTPSSTYGSNAEPAMYDSSPSYESRGIYSTTQPGFNEYGVRKTPEVDSYSPVQGNKGTQVNVYLRSDYDLLADPALLASVVFGLHRVPASLTRLESSGPHFQFVTSTAAPNFSDTSSSTTQLSLHLQLQEKSGQDAGLLQVGYFQYVASILGSSPQTQDGSRKRKLSESGVLSAQNMDRHSSVSSTGYAYPPSLHSSDSGSLQRKYTGYGRAQNKFRDITSRRGTQNLSMDPAERSMMRPPHSHSASFSPSYSVVSSTGRYPAVDSSTTSPARLIRTSHLQQSPGSSHGGPGPGPTFNPYPWYGQKVVLKLKGNLNSMTENWTTEEWAAKRRLVQFFRTRSQDGCTINAQYAPVKPEDRQPNSITISCIWWEERQECFATSVDTIALLEQLVEDRFTVEEKNRIRRNLEGFKPLTVAKGRADSEEFFKVIMGFPNPKPRNIEKDVKVFEWKILAGALKKVLSKYSASKSSTTGPLYSSHSSIFNGYKSEGIEDRYARVSRSASNSTASSNYTHHTLKSNLPSPVETLPSQYSEAPTSASFTSLGHSYSSPSLAPSFQSHDQISAASPPIGYMPHHQQHHYPAMSLERSRSYHTFTDYDGDLDTDADADGDIEADNRYMKRPRASTTSSIAAPFYRDSAAVAITNDPHANATNNTASAYYQSARSFSEQPDHRPPPPSASSMQTQQLKQHLPSLSEDYAIGAHPSSSSGSSSSSSCDSSVSISVTSGAGGSAATQMYMPQPMQVSGLARAGRF